MEKEIEVSPSISIIEKAKQSENEQKSFMEPGKPEKKRGRPKKVAIETEQKKEDSIKKDDGPKIPTKVICYPITRVVSNIGVAVTQDTRAKMNDDEIESISEGLALVFDKYLPSLLGNYGPELALVTAMGQYSFRLYAISQLKIEEEKKRDQTKTKVVQPDFQQKSDSFDLRSDSVELPQPML